MPTMLWMGLGASNGKLGPITGFPEAAQEMADGVWRGAYNLADEA